MRVLRWAVAAVVVLGLCPATAGAFSFGTFAPGEKILSIQVGSGLPATPSVVYDDTTITLSFSAPVTTITTTLATYNIPLGDVVFDSTVMLSTATILPPITFPPFGGTIAATFLNGMTADLSITDVAGGFALLLAADYDAGLKLSISKVGAAPVSGSLGGSPGGDFSLIGGDAAFVAAFGPTGNYFANLSSFTSDGSAVTTLCHLIKNMTSACPRPGTSTPPSGQLDDFTTNPAATISRTAPLPEPGLAWLLAGAGLAGLARRRRWR
jgi:hypothetical protein